LQIVVLDKTSRQTGPWVGALSCGTQSMHFVWMFGVLIPKARRRIAGDRLAVAKSGSIERKAGKFALAR
jgi:hypothetical protein